MAFDLAIRFRGLIVHYLPQITPDGYIGQGEPPTIKTPPVPQALIVQQEGHYAVLKYRDGHGDEQVFALSNHELKLNLGDNSTQGKDFTPTIGRESNLNEIKHRFPSIPSEKKYLGWLPSLHAAHADVEGLKAECFESLNQTHLVNSRFRFDFGTLGVRGLSRWKTKDPILWDTVPRKSPYQRRAQILAERVELRVSGLTEPVTLRLDDHSTGLEIPLHPSHQEKVVVVRIENQPCYLTGKDDDYYPERLGHYGYYYRLVEWRKDEPDELPVPYRVSSVPEGGRKFRGGDVFCPSTSYP